MHPSTKAIFSVTHISRETRLWKLNADEVNMSKKENGEWRVVVLSEWDVRWLGLTRTERTTCLLMESWAQKLTANVSYLACSLVACQANWPQSSLTFPWRYAHFSRSIAPEYNNNLLLVPLDRRELYINWKIHSTIKSNKLFFHLL